MSGYHIARGFYLTHINCVLQRIQILVEKSAGRCHVKIGSEPVNVCQYGITVPGDAVQLQQWPQLGIYGLLYFDLLKGYSGQIALQWANGRRTD